jgi:hypothetical protein
MAQQLLYRAGLVTAAASFLVAASGAFLPEGNAVGDAVRQGADLFYAAGAGGLGLSLMYDGRWAGWYQDPFIFRLFVEIETRKKTKNPVQL